MVYLGEFHDVKSKNQVYTKFWVQPGVIDEIERQKRLRESGLSFIHANANIRPIKLRYIWINLPTSLIL